MMGSSAAEEATTAVIHNFSAREYRVGSVCGEKRTNLLMKCFRDARLSSWSASACLDDGDDDVK